MRAEIAQLLNGERAFRGFGQLPVDAELSRSAQAWAEHIQSVGCQPPTNCHSPDAEAEILAWGGPESKTGEIVVAWMHSAVHRDILLHPKAVAMGVGFACSADGTVTTAVHFSGIRNPVPATEESPIASSVAQGSPCVGYAAPLSQTAPPSTTTSVAPPPTTAPPRATPPTHPPAPATAAPVAPTTLPAQPTPPPTSAAMAVAPSTMPTTTPTTTQRIMTVVLSAEASSVAPPPEVAPLAFANEPLTSPPKAESAWIGMVVVVVFLSVLRVGLQLRDNTNARVKERARSLGL